ncbi:hypothetical protein QYY77_07265 [Xanthomonas campestris pv. campestris]|uniref:hypothetical protein n=1 Tax=Xanthomonas campestris TaxID=339 RepID=UPI0023652A02|nr:hypothetical protein [Xanthomonas campestris]MEA0735881.1 hypothetical protein [Xanthomonas campestris pv. campestris]MEA9783974.1 hypothetical protein [Xanthomonas campestris pv. raphani]MEA9792025.1 hypothetical protein [Xanthomonas campestris pv. raphani]MEA9803868.1 hypothetical protein [Xanthomonas campestris pv. raphani]MEA9820101.1 hypothetical protein [Xanthomonas campestris pv. raphani]
MTASKALSTTARRRATPGEKLQTYEQHFTFGVTIEQIDRFHTLLRTITAQSDMVAVCSGKPLDATSLSVLGESIFNAARAVRGVVDEIYEQRLGGDGPADAVEASRQRGARV